MRLTLINQFYTPDLSPTAHMCASVAEHRAALGDDVTVVTSRAGYLGRLQGDEADTSVRVHRVWSTQFGSRTKLTRLVDWMTFYVFALNAVARLEPQDIVIAMTTPPFIAWAGVLHKLLSPDAKLVLWNMDCWPETAERLNMIRSGGLLNRLLRQSNRLLFHHIDHVVCLDDAMARLLAGYAPDDRPLPYTIIPNWERAELFPAGAVVQPWNNPIEATISGTFVILYLGNAGFLHEFETVLAAAEKLRDDPVTFLFVGGGSHFNWLREQAQRRKLGNILLHDYVSKDQTPSVMRLSDCALITLEDAGLGVMSPSKLHANLAMGLPVLYVGPAGGNVDEAIRRFGCGVSVRVGESEKLVSSIRQLMSDESHQQDLRARARRAFEEAYCDTQTLPLFDEVLKSVP